MKKPLIFGAAVAAALFTGGYVVGQLHSPATSSAANATKSLAVAKMAGSGGPQRWAHRFDGPRAFGQVTALSGSKNKTVTIKGFIGPRGLQFAPPKIVLTSNTKYYSGLRSSTTSAAVKVGTYIAARGVLSSDKKTLTANVLMVLPGVPKRLRFGEHHRFMVRFDGAAAVGKVTAVAGNSISVKAPAFGWRSPEQVTSIVLTGSTKFYAGPFAQVTRSSLKVGAIVAARGSLSKDGKTLTADSVTVLPAGLREHRFMWRHAGATPGDFNAGGNNI